MESPKTLQDAILFFANPDNCVAYMVAQRWPDGVVICPTCGRNDVSWLANQRKWQCKSKHAKRQFSAKVGTIFEDSPLGLDKWLMATWMITNCKNGVSSYEIARNLGVTQKSAWFMLHRIRIAMGDVDPGKMGGNGPIEIDETFVGGKVKNMHRSKRVKGMNYSAGNGKTIVMGLLERGGKVRAGVIKDRKAQTMRPALHNNVEAGSHIITDEHSTYPFIAGDYFHEVINHIDGYPHRLSSAQRVCYLSIPCSVFLGRDYTSLCFLLRFQPPLQFHLGHAKNLLHCCIEFFALRHAHIIDPQMRKSFLVGKSFLDARLKIERADHHIGRINSQIAALEKSDVATVEINPEFGNEVIKHDIVDRKIRDSLALIAGDSFHNLKCALDYAWIGTITYLAPCTLGKFAKFPAYPTRDALEAALRSNGIDKAPRDLFKVMVDEIQPYKAGNYAVWPIHRLNIRDKHRLLIPTILYSSVSGIETQDEAGEVSTGGFTYGTHQEPPWYINMRPGVHVKNNGKVSLSVSFNYGSELDETVFADSLNMYSQAILGVVQVLETLV